MEEPMKRAPYARVNDVGLPHTPLEDHEAITAARKLYRLARKLMERPQITLPNLKVKRGKRFYTRVRHGVVNPQKGWWHLVHDISHAIGGKHGFRHNWLELQLAEHVKAQGWLDGKLRKRPIKLTIVRDQRRVRYERVIESIARWEGKMNRAKNKLRKLHRTKIYYEKTLNL